MSCNIGLHNAVTKVLNQKPWFKYKKGDSYIEILDSPSSKINRDNAIGVARTLSNELNKMINDGYKKIGVVFYPRFMGEKRIVSIDASARQLDLINATDAQEAAQLQKEILENEQMLADQIEGLTPEEIAENKEFLASEPFIEQGEVVTPIEQVQIVPEQLRLFQLPTTYQTTATPQTIEALKNLLERLSIPVETSETILEEFGANGLADGIRRVIQIANGKEDVALTEETMHMLTMMVPEAVLDELLEQITDYKMYAAVYEQYKEHPAYQNEDGSPNLEKIRLEAAGKILAEYYIMNSAGLSKEEVNIAKTLWAKIKDWIKSIFGANKDAFQDFINKIDTMDYRVFGMNSRAQNLLNIAFGKEEIASFADAIVGDLTSNDYDSAKRAFERNSTAYLDPSVKTLMELEALIRDIKTQDLPFIQNMKEYVHLPNKRAFATGKYKLEKATEEIDENKDFVEELKRRTTESLEYIRNTYATVSSLNDRAQMIQTMINQDVDLLSPLEDKPKLTDLQRVRLFHELAMIKDIAENYDNQMLDLSELFSDVKDSFGITEVIDKTRDLISQINRVDNTLGRKNLKETIQKFITPQQEGYKKQKNKEILDIQKQLNDIDQEIAKRGSSKSRLAKKKKLEDRLLKAQDDLKHPPVSVDAIMDILENSSKKKENLFGVTPIDMLMEAGRTNKNQAILAVSTILSDAILESQRSAEADFLTIKDLFEKYNRKQNLAGTAYDDITDQVVRYKFDEESGELEEWNENVLVNEVKQWQFENDLEVLRYLKHLSETSAGDIGFIEKEYTKYLGQKLTAEERSDLANTFKNKYNDLMNIYGKRKYIDKYYEIQAILDDAVLSDGRTVRQYRQTYIDEIKRADEELDDILTSGMNEDVALSAKQQALRELQKLESLFDYNTGLKKEGDALMVAETILKWKKAKKNVEVAPGVFADIDKYYSTYASEFKWKEQKDTFEKDIEDARKLYEENPSAINQEALRIAEGNYERWRKRNVIKRPPAEYYKQKARIVQAIQTILDGTKQYVELEQQYKLEVDEAWDIIRSATAGNRDEDGVIEGGQSQNIAEQVKRAEEVLDDLKNTIKPFRSRMSEEEMFMLTKLINELDDMQESTTTSYWDDLLEAKVDIKKKEMVRNGIENPTFDQIMSELIEEDFFQKNLMNVTSKYAAIETEKLPQDVIRFTTIKNGKKIIRTYRPIYIWRDTLTKGKYEKQDQMAYSLMRYDIDDRFVNPNYETMYGTVSLDPSKITADPIAKNRYFDEKFAGLNSTQKDFLNEYREMYYKDQMFKPRSQRLGDTLPRITMEGIQRTAKTLNPWSWKQRFTKFFTKGLGTSTMEAEYGEGKAFEGRKGKKSESVKIFAKYTNTDANIATPEKDLFRLLTMYNIERHRVESLKDYVPALNKALELGRDKKIFKPLYTQVQYFLNKRSRAKEFGKVSKYILDPLTDAVRSARGFLQLGLPHNLTSIYKNTIVGSYAMWVNRSRLRQYSEAAFTNAWFKAAKKAVEVVSQQFSSTPSKYMAMVRRLKVVVNLDINDATTNNRVISLKTANGLGYGLGSVRRVSETQLDLAMFELYRSGNKITIDGMAYDIEDCYEYKNGTLTPKMIPSKNEDGSVKIDSEGNPVMVPMITPEQENDITKNVLEMVSYTQGNFANDNISMMQTYMLGRTLLFMRKFIWNPLMVRAGEKRITATGHEIEGFYRTLYGMIKSSLTDMKNGKYAEAAENFKTLSPDEKSAMRMFMKDFAMINLAGLLVYAVEKALKEGDDDEENPFGWYAFLLYRKVFAELSFFNPADRIGTLLMLLFADDDSGYKMSGNQVSSTLTYAVGRPTEEFVATMIIPFDHKQMRFSEDDIKTKDPFYSQFKDNVLLYNFVRSVNARPDFYHSKDALRGFEWYNRSMYEYLPAEEKSKGKGRRKRL